MVKEMSLVTLNSLQQDPASFQNHLPQPLVLGKRSQVCLLRLTHFREKTRYVVTGDNNGISFMIGTPPDNAVRVARVAVGAYTGAELALEVATALNNACLQQQWIWTCTFTAAAAAADDDQFECTATLGAAPAAEGGLWTGPASDYVITGDPTDQAIAITTIAGATRSDEPCLLKQGIFGLNGAVTVYGIDIAANNITVGLVREGLSSSFATNPEMRFNQHISDIMVEINPTDGLLVGHLEETGVIGEPGWRTPAWERQIPAATLLTICPTGSFLGVRIAAMPTNSQFVVQILVSADGVNWIAVVDGAGGNDANGNPFVKSLTGTPGFVFLSNDATTYEDGIRVPNLYKSKNLPLLPYFVQNSAAAKEYAVAVVQNPVARAGPPIEGSLPHDTALVHRDLKSGGTFTNSSGGTSTFADHYSNAEYKETRQTSATSHLNLPSGNTWTQNISSNTESFDTTNLGSIATYRRVSSAGYVHWWEATSTTGWNIYFTEPVLGSVPDNTAVADLASGVLSFAGGSTTFTPAQMPSTVPATSEHWWRKVTDTIWHIFNSEPTASSVPAATATVHHGTGVLTLSDFSTKTPTTSVQKVDSSGPTLGTGNRQVTMLFNRLDNADRTQFAPAWTNPVDLLTNHGGTLGGTLGYPPSFQQNNAAGTQTFTSNRSPVKVSNTSTLHVSIPELQGLVSYDGARSDVAKTIAVLTRGEFGDEAVDGTQTHISPHQNWLDIHNASPLALNQLSVQLRDDSGTIVQDLDPETSLTIKFQQDPVFKQQEHTQHLLQAMQRQQQGQPMMKVSNVGS